jgi:hypothetical protein
MVNVKESIGNESDCECSPLICTDYTGQEEAELYGGAGELNNKLLKVEHWGPYVREKTAEMVLIRRVAAETGSSGRQKFTAKINVAINQ